MGHKDHLIEITKPTHKPGWMSQEQYDLAPACLTVRELCCGGKVLVTTLLNTKQTPKAELNNLYCPQLFPEDCTSQSPCFTKPS